jgi:hypothetical protein
MAFEDTFRLSAHAVITSADGHVLGSVNLRVKAWACRAVRWNPER